MAGRPDLLTVGHGTMDRNRLGSLVAGAGVELLVDVRSFPGSRRNPDVGREVLAQWLPGRGIDYQWEKRLGGRRRLPTGAPVEDTWWQVEAFRSYATYTRTPEFATGLDSLLEQAAGQMTAILCSESVWWRCHRRIIADVAVLQRHCSVRHLMPDGRLTEHPVADGARLMSEGRVVWDGPPAR